MQERCNSSALAMELHLFCINPPIKSPLMAYNLVRYNYTMYSIVAEIVINSRV